MKGGMPLAFFFSSNHTPLDKHLKGRLTCIMYAGHEKLRYVGGGVTIITKNHVESDSLVKCADEILKGHGVNPNSVYMNIIKIK